MGNRKIIAISAIIIIAFFFYGIWGFYSPKDRFLEEETIFSISKGEGFLEIGSNLEKENIIKNDLFFNIYVFFSGRYRRLQAGTYLLSPSMSVSEIAKKISSGDVFQKRITIVEGWNVYNIAEYLNDTEVADKDRFLEIVNEPSFFDGEFDFLTDKPREAGLEGYLFPDTYLIPYGASEKEIVKIMLDNFNTKVYSVIGEDVEPLFEAIVMASMIEREVRTLEDKELVAGILWKRMKIGMPLQVDATIIYVTGKRTTRISIEETQVDSPYNTYRYRGLPVGPISNPGIESIKAAVYPRSSDYLYYLSKPSGETVFSRTLDEHNVAKADYLR